ncbi:kelch-like protein 40a [Lineus longissimus]|uniref:kelch-like protein 40a n=1 Tax=Lineus longissimus TaxID=88925 RepID=UPI00315C7FB0
MAYSLPSSSADASHSSLTTPSPPSQAERGLENVFTDTRRPISIMEGLAKLYETKHLVDVTLCIGSREFLCHKNVLAISSPYFMAMFSHDMLENVQNKVKLKDIDSDTLDGILRYIYRGEIALTESSVQNILSAANIFQLEKLKAGCEAFMMKHINKTNCIEVYFFAKAHECDALAKKSREIICTHFTDLYQRDEFLCLPLDNLVDIIADSDLNISTEEIVYSACLKWINHDLETRKNDAGRVLCHVRFANISSYYFCDFIESNPMVRDCNALQDTLAKVRYYHMLKNRKQELDLNFTTRKGMNVIQGVLIIANPYSEENHMKFNSMEMLLPHHSKLLHVCRLPQSLYMPGCCVAGDHDVYLAGGSVRKLNYRGSITSEEVSNYLYLFNCSSRTWEVKAKLKQPRSQLVLVAVDRFLYCIGGSGGMEILSNLDRYDGQTNQWCAMAPLPEALRCMTAVSYKGKLYSFGGEASNGKIVNSVYRYDPSDNKWTNLPPMLKSRALAGSAVFKEKIYVIGGNTAVSEKWKREFLPEHCTSSVEIFDPADNTWMLGPELPHPLCGAGVVKYGNSILVVGGEDDKSWMAGICSLQMEEGKHQWIEGEPLPTVMSTFGCIVATLPRESMSQDMLT